ncbi:S-adenosyl-L-methionine-dependent methyltransferase [Thelephora ganbajun]|uniref:S-adenosyl-L-methionine-dependent methyltransferase n=1 Tax=Thelephora ganbajun TaxID=370292 RepID=A0ACB6ZLT2_THEGA|nr:S-adenosyl-L-methionine-dependent methyltransferase [Thelephora ganbajun]
MDALDEFVPFSLSAFFTGTLVYAFREFYVVLRNVQKFEDGRTGYMNYGFWNNGPSTKNPHASLAEAVIGQLDIRILNKHTRSGQVNLLEIGCGLGQPAIDAVHSLGSNVNVTGVSICQGHVATANKLAASAGLSPKITHHLLNATEIDTLQSAPFSGAYSCEVLSEIPDDGLRACFAALHNTLPPGAEFSYADIVRTGATITSRLSGPLASRGFFEKLLLLVAPAVVTMTYGDDWRPVSKFNSLLSQAGFEVLSTESIGDRVFVPSWDYAREEMKKRPGMGIDRSLFLRWMARFLAWATLRGLTLLWEAGQIDYVLVKARRV